MIFRVDLLKNANHGIAVKVFILNDRSSPSVRKKEYQNKHVLSVAYYYLQNRTSNWKAVKRINELHIPWRLESQIHVLFRISARLFKEHCIQQINRNHVDKREQSILHWLDSDFSG